MTVARRRCLLAAALLPSLVVASCSGSPGPSTAASAGEGAGRLTVFAAASLHGTLEDVADVVAEEHPGVDVSFSFAGSSDLVSQVVAGAPADVLATADEVTMADAVGAGVVGTPTVFAENVLALVVPAGNPAGVTGVDGSLEGAALVVCAPQVPCGAAAVALAEQAGVTLRPVSEESSVTDVLGKVTSGQADAGLVYATDAVSAGDAVDVVPVEGAGTVVNRYPVAVATGAADPALAEAFVEVLTSPAGRAVLTEHGFRLP